VAVDYPAHRPDRLGTGAAPLERLEVAVEAGVERELRPGGGTPLADCGEEGCAFPLRAVRVVAFSVGIVQRPVFGSLNPAM
jgi:hypothetical protein